MSDPQTNITGDPQGPVYSGDIGQVGDRHTNTGGGAYIEGDVSADTFIGRDQINLIFQQERRLFIGVPARPNHFVGRLHLVDQLVAQLCTGTTTALSAEGLPGVGKTTLAVMLAHHRTILDHFRDGVLWAGLGRTPELPSLLASWAMALGIDVTDLPTAEGRARAVGNAIGTRRLLLVVDDAWQAEAALLFRCGGPGCAHLLTTRDQAIARTFAGATQVTAVPVLADDAAFALLQQLAPEVCAADPAAVRALAAAVGNLPLALELIGGYLAAPERSYFPELSAEALAELTDPRRRLALAQTRLGDERRATVTLHETIALSLVDLPTQVRAAFHALGVFAPKPASFDLEAAKAVTGADIHTLALLIARNLLERQGESLSLHQTIADVSADRCGRISALPAEATVRHCEYYLALVDADEEDWQRIEAVYAQLSYAWRQMSIHHTSTIAFVYSLSIFQTRRGLWQERLMWLERALESAQTHNDMVSQSRMLHELGFVYYSLGDQRKALVYYDQALQLFQIMDDHAGEATTLTSIGAAYDVLGERQEALVHYEKALPLRRIVKDSVGEATTLNNIGMIYDALGQKQEALAYYEQALQLSHVIGDRGTEAIVLNNIGLVYADLGEKSEALTYYEQALLLSRAVGDYGREAVTLNNIGLSHYALGENQKALVCYEQALPLYHAIGDRWRESITRFNLAMVHRVLKDLAAAEEQLTIVVALDEAIGHPDLESDRVTLVEVQQLRAQYNTDGAADGLRARGSTGFPVTNP